MPVETSLPRRMTVEIPENGYASPSMFESDHDPMDDAEPQRRPGPRSLPRRMAFMMNEEDTLVAVEEPAPTPSPADKLDEKSLDRQQGSSRKIGIRDRIKCYTWTWFTMNMATGGIANVLHAIPFRSDWLQIIGVIFMIFNMCLFVMNCCLLTLRFIWVPGSFRESFLSQKEALFIPASIVSAGTIVINIEQYGIPYTGEWLLYTMRVIFWMYLALSILVSSGMYLLLWSTQTFPIHTMTPIWVFPAYPLLLIAPMAGNLIDSCPDAAAAARINSLAIVFGAVCVQGTGFLVSLMIYSAFIYRLMTAKLPRETTRPGIFVSVGPSGFTIAGLVHIGNTLMTKVMPDGYLGVPQSAFFLKIISDLVGLWLWGFAAWFVLVSIGAHWQVMRPHHPQYHIKFDMTWFSFVFPNTAFVTATQSIGRSFNIESIKIVGTVLSVMLVVLWMFVFGLMLKSIWTKRILMPETKND